MRMDNHGHMAQESPPVWKHLCLKIGGKIEKQRRGEANPLSGNTPGSQSPMGKMIRAWLFPDNQAIHF